MRAIARVLGALILIVTGLALGWWIHDRELVVQTVRALETDSAPTIEQIESLSYLTALRVNVADAIVTELQGKTGGIKVVLVVHGVVTLGVDLSKARFESVDPSHRTAVLVLPAPQIQSVSLDQQKTKIVALVKSGLWIIVPGGGEADAVAVNMAYRGAETVVARTAQDPELMERARRQAEEVLKRFLTSIGWMAQMHWASAPRPGDLRLAEV